MKLDIDHTLTLTLDHCDVQNFYKRDFDLYHMFDAGLLMDSTVLFKIPSSTDPFFLITGLSSGQLLGAP